MSVNKDLNHGAAKQSIAIGVNNNETVHADAYLDNEEGIFADRYFITKRLL